MDTAPAPIDTKSKLGGKLADLEELHLHAGSLETKVILQTTEPPDVDKIAQAVRDLLHKDRKDGIDDLIHSIVNIREQLNQDRASFRQREEGILQNLRSKTDDLEKVNRRNRELEQRVKIVDELRDRVNKLDESRRKGNLQVNVIKQKQRDLQAEVEKDWEERLKFADEMGDTRETAAKDLNAQIKHLHEKAEEDKDTIDSLTAQVNELTWKLAQRSPMMYPDDASEWPLEQQEPLLSEEDERKISELEQERDECDRRLKDEYNEDKIERLRKRYSFKKKALDLMESEDEDYQKEKDQVEAAERAVTEAPQKKGQLDRRIQKCKEEIEAIRKEARERRNSTSLPRINAPPVQAGKRTGKRGAPPPPDSAVGGLDSQISRSRGTSVTGGSGDLKESQCPTCGQRRWSSG